jgi:hypothetical protein
MIELPMKKTAVTRVDPKTLILFGMYKCGKTTAVAELDDCLTLDLEEGSDFVSSVRIDVQKEARKEGVEPLIILMRVIKQIEKANKDKGGYVYKRIALDTVTALEDVVLPMAAKMYRATPMGRNWVGDDVTTLPNGAGYRYTREAMKKVVNSLADICDTLIILGHVKDKLIEVQGEEMNERGLDLTGKMPSILCSQVDAIGYVYREDEKTMINFQTSSSLSVGARSNHLKNKKICVATSDENNVVSVDWSEIFIADNL